MMHGGETLLSVVYTRVFDLASLKGKLIDAFCEWECPNALDWELEDFLGIAYILSVAYVQKCRGAREQPD